MRSYGSQPGKTPGNDSDGASRKNDKPARITVFDGDGGTEHYDVEHHIRSEKEGWVSLFITREGGIDVQIPRERVISIERGRENHQDVETSGERELVTDGGRQAGEVARQLADQSQYVENGQIEVSRQTVIVDVTGERSVSIDASRGRVSEVVNTLARAVSRAAWEEYDQDEGDADGE